MTTIQTSRGEYTGKTVESIIRRVYGQKAWVNWSGDPNAPQAGEIVTASKHQKGMDIQAVLYSWAGDREDRTADMGLVASFPDE